MERMHAVPFGLAGFACLSIALLGCAGNGNGLDADGRPLTANSTAPEPLAATIDSLQRNIFTPICTKCHAGASAPEGLRLDAANSYNLLVGVASTEVPSIERVKVGDPDNSYIVQKLEGHAAVGAQMPFGGPYLPSTTIAFVRQWITDGAQPSATAAASNAPLEVLTSTPAAREVLAESPPQVMIGLSRALDLTRVDENTAHIERLGADNAPVAARLRVSAQNPRALFLWPDAALPTGDYRVTFAGEGPSSVVATFSVGVAP
jgi:hypothetical protein